MMNEDDVNKEVKNELKINLQKHTHLMLYSLQNASGLKEAQSTSNQVAANF